MFRADVIQEPVDILIPTMDILVPTGFAGVIGSDVPWLECPACNALTWVITVTE